MKSFFKKVITPDENFEQWSEAHNVCPKKERKPQKRLVLQLATAFASVVLVVCAILPFVLKGGKGSGGVTTPPNNNKVYSTQDVVTKSIDMETYLGEGFLFFDESLIWQMARVAMAVAKDDETLVLSYDITSAVILINDGEYIFDLDLKARVYDEYEFYGITEYIDLSPLPLADKNVAVSYAIVTNAYQCDVATVYFKRNGVDYYLDIRGFEGITDITVDTITVLLSELLV